ncbi:MAG: hypothetical protein JWM21_4204 [Acidobacteria bacterium]|nr:hypothetical protein [Acidobacteriota bacterium]
MLRAGSAGWQPAVQPFSTIRGALPTDIEFHKRKETVRALVRLCSDDGVGHGGGSPRWRYGHVDTRALAFLG